VKRRTLLPSRLTNTPTGPLCSGLKEMGHSACTAATLERTAVKAVRVPSRGASSTGNPIGTISPAAAGTAGALGVARGTCKLKRSPGLTPGGITALNMRPSTVWKDISCPLVAWGGAVMVSISMRKPAGDEQAMNTDS